MMPKKRCTPAYAGIVPKAHLQYFKYRHSIAGVVHGRDKEVTQLPARDTFAAAKKRKALFQSFTLFYLCCYNASGLPMDRRQNATVPAVSKEKRKSAESDLRQVKRKNRHDRVTPEKACVNPQRPQYAGKLFNKQWGTAFTGIIKCAVY